MKWRAIHDLFREFRGIENVVGVGRGQKWVRGENTGQEAVLVFVRKKYPKNELKRSVLIPDKIQETVTDIVEIGDIRLFAESRTEKKRPAYPGISIGHYKVSAGTFGAVVRDRNTGELLILSNNHVLANLSNGFDERAKVGDAIIQPGLYDGGDSELAVIGHLKRFIPLQTEISQSRCKIAKLFEKILNDCIHVVRPRYRIQVFRENELVNFVDCAVAAPTSPELIVPEIAEVGAVTGVKDPKLGMTIKKSGRSTGLTFSIIIATDVTLKVAVGESEYAVFTDQILAGPMCMPGDSGALVLSEDNQAVGLLFAGSEEATLFCPINRVFDSLNIMF